MSRSCRRTLSAGLAAASFLVAGSADADCVILVHGLARTSNSMLIMAEALDRRGHNVILVDYPSTTATIDALADAVLPNAVKACDGQTVSAVGHSMGGLLLRTWLGKHKVEKLGSVVMLGTPNKGSALADAFENIELFHWMNGPAGEELSEGSHGIHHKLPPADFKLGVIAGDQSFNPIYSRIVPGTDDGKVAVESTKVEGMSDFIVLHTSHTFMMKNPVVIAQVAHFLEEGTFEKPYGYFEAIEYLSGTPESQ